MDKLHVDELLASGALELRYAAPADAEKLSHLAEKTFRDAYASDNKASDMEAYVSEAFGPGLQRAEIEDEANAVIVADRSGTLVGYAHMVEDRATGAFDLLRLYVDRSWQGSGLGKRLVDQALDECRRRGLPRLRLTVWERNIRAIAFYERTGFRKTGRATFTLGEDVQTDFVMEMPAKS